MVCQFFIRYIIYMKYVGRNLVFQISIGIYSLHICMYILHICAYTELILNSWIDYLTEYRVFKLA